MIEEWRYAWLYSMRHPWFGIHCTFNLSTYRRCATEKKDEDEEHSGETSRTAGESLSLVNIFVIITIVYVVCPGTSINPKHKRSESRDRQSL